MHAELVDLSDDIYVKWKVAWNNFKFSDIINNLFIYGRFICWISQISRSRSLPNIKVFHLFFILDVFHEHHFNSLICQNCKTFEFSRAKTVVMTKIVSSKAIGRWVISQLTFSLTKPTFCSSSSTSSTTANRRPHTQKPPRLVCMLRSLRPLFGRQEFQR